MDGGLPCPHHRFMTNEAEAKGSRQGGDGAARDGSQTRAVITAATATALEAELTRLRRTLKVDFAERLREARADGPAGGNDDYLQVKEEEAILISSISRLEALLASATVAEPDASGDRIHIGAAVQVEDLDTQAVEELAITGDYATLAPHGVSASSPLGRALLGRVVGDEIEAELPNGKVRRLRVLALGSPGGEPAVATA
jgi:transcription elongation factor GreA